MTAAIRRIADSESPPRSKNESSTPTRSTAEHVGKYAGQNLLGERGRGAVIVAVLILGRRQGTPVEFAVDRQRQRVDATTAAGTIYAGSCSASAARAVAGSAVPVM